jgi:2-hydroxy-6-oxonona-2,4-dienedioate hydrolase
LITVLLISGISIGLSPSQAQTGSIKGPRKFIDVNGIRTSYFEAGSGEDIVLIHGGEFGSPTSSAATFTAWFPSLSAHFHVIAVDKLGMGFTDNPRTDADYSMTAVTDHILHFIEKMGIKKVALLGQSRGALPAARLAIDHPELVKTLIIFDSTTLAPDTAPMGPSEGRNSAFHTPVDVSGKTPINEESIFSKLLLTVHNKGNVTGQVKDEWVKQSLEIARLPKMRECAERLALLRSRFVERHPEEIKARPALEGEFWLYKEKDATLDMIREGRLHVPTLIVWGADDPGAAYEHGVQLFELVRKSVGRAQFHLYNEQNHWGWVDHPQEMTDLLVSFVRNQVKTE